MSSDPRDEAAGRGGGAEPGAAGEAARLMALRRYAVLDTPVDPEFEAFLLEVLSDFQVSVPEVGTFEAKERPLVFLTSNDAREMTDALKRRCLYHWIDYPDLARELAIVKAKVPRASERLTREVVAFVQALRKEDLFKNPGTAETLDWASALVELDAKALDPALIGDTLGEVLKYQDDVERFNPAQLDSVLSASREALKAAG